MCISNLCKSDSKNAQSYRNPSYSLIIMFSQGSKKKTKPDPQLQVSTTDVTTHAGLVKMLLQPQDKIRYKDLREGTNTTFLIQRAYEVHVKK